MGDFARDINLTIGHEVDPRYPDAVTNYSWDPGGVTKYGISKRYNPDVDVANLTLPQAQAIYHERYWKPAGCEALPEPLAYFTLEAAVNPGLGYLPAMRAAARPFVIAPDADALLMARIAHYVDLCVKHPEKLPSLPGWIRRCLQVRAEGAAR